jgi:hypothetical protein
MKRLIFLIAILLSLPAFATTVSGTRVQQGVGQILASGSWCFAGSGCFTVTNGVFSGTVTAGSNTVTVVSGATTYLTVPAVIINGTSFTWDTFILSGSATGIGAPYIACTTTATYTQTDTGTAWACNNVAGQPTWQVASTGAVSPSGSYTGWTTPNFVCTAPCTYTDYSLSPFWSTTANSGFSANSWIQINPANSALFSAIGPGQNTTSAMNVGAGASLTSTGGLISATALNSANVTGNPTTTGQCLLSTSTTGASWGTCGSGGSGTVTSFSASGWPSWLSPTVATPTTTPALSVSASAIPNAALASSAITINGTVMSLGGSYTLGGGSGSVTSFSAGNLLPLFTTSVTTATSTPALAFTLSNAAAGTVLGNPTGSSAQPSFTASPVVTSITAGSVTDSGLTAGNCVQAGTGGVLMTTSGACGSGGGSSSQFSLILVDTSTSLRYSLAVRDGQLRVTSLGSTGTASPVNGIYSGSNYYEIAVTNGALNIITKTSSYPAQSEYQLVDTLLGSLYDITVTAGGALQIAVN